MPGPQYLDRPVYVLTSADTFSGGEEFAYDLKTQGRATLIGETTRGGAHPTSWHQLTEHLTVTVPGARSINPIHRYQLGGCVGVELRISPSPLNRPSTSHTSKRCHDSRGRRPRA